MTQLQQGMQPATHGAHVVHIKTCQPWRQRSKKEAQQDGQQHHQQTIE
jgi:hypothetical protein